MAVSSPTRWAGVSLVDRRAERRVRLLDAAFAVFGDGGEAALSVRSVCRECNFNTRYFYESFADTDELLGATYDQVAEQLSLAVATAIGQAGGSVRARMTAGITAVLGFSSADPRRGRLLFTDARANPVLAARRALAQDLLREIVLAERENSSPASDPIATHVGAAMYAGAMAELAQQWLSGDLGDDVDVVVRHAVTLVLKR